jgi:hypothetical protein
MRRLLGTVLAVSAGAAAAEMRLGGITELEFAVDTGGAAQQAELTVTPELEWRSRWGFDLTAIARLRTDAYDRLEPGQPSQDSVARWTRREFLSDHTELELRELYVDAYLGSTYLRLGKQQIVWGEADGLKVLDLVNPQNFREFILDEFEDSRIPLWSVKWEVPVGGSWNAQLVLVPDQTYHQVPAPGAVFAPTSPELVPRLPADTPVTVREPRVPDHPLEDADAGVQLSAYLGGWDVTLNYLYHYADTPAVSVTRDVAGVAIQSRYYRTHTFGGTLSNAFGDFTLRSEIGYSTDRHFPASAGAISGSRTEPPRKRAGDDVGLVKTGELSYVVGIDWMGLTDTLVSAQLFQSWADVGDAAERDAWESDATLLVERNLRNDTIKLGVLAIHDLDRGDGVVTGTVSYDYQSNVRLRLAASTFYGSARGRFGQFDGRDRVLLGVEYGF